MTERSKYNKKLRRHLLKETEFRMQHKWVRCRECDGSGWIHDVAFEDDPCSRCDGEGGWWVERNDPLSDIKVNITPIDPQSRPWPPNRPRPISTTERYLRGPK